ncbi:MAG TPA: hypothetical protein VF172_08020 [Nitrososphaera sp.]
MATKSYLEDEGTIRCCDWAVELNKPMYAIIYSSSAAKPSDQNSFKKSAPRRIRGKYYFCNKYEFDLASVALKMIITTRRGCEQYQHVIGRIWQTFFYTKYFIILY